MAVAASPASPPVAPSTESTPAPTGPVWEGRVARPTRAAAVAIFGAAIVALESVSLLLLPHSYSPNLGGVVFSATTLGELGLAQAAVLVGAAVWAFQDPTDHLEYGVVIITIAVLSLFTGGGYLLGALCAYVGGLLVIFHDPTKTPVSPPVPAPSVEPEADVDPVVEADLIDSGRAEELPEPPSGGSS